MKTKTLVLLLIILGVLAGAGTLIIRLKTPERSQGYLGTHLLKQLPANEIASITIKSSDDSVSLVKKRDQWVVMSRFDYPADFLMITDLVRNLKEAKVGRRFESSEDTLKRLSLKDPDDPDAPEDEKGVRIYLKDVKEKHLANILLGKVRKRGDEGSFSDGQYLKLVKESDIYLIDKHFSSLGEDSAAWLEKDLVKVGADEIKKISCQDADGKKRRYLFERPEKGKELLPVGLSKAQKIEKSALNRLAGALSSLRMEDVANPSAISQSKDMEFYTLIEYHLFNGIIYHLYPSKACSDKERCYLKIQVDYKRPISVKDEKTKEETSKKEETGPEKTPEEYVLEAKRLNERLSPWVYVIPKWKHSAFETDLEQLLEKPDKKKAGKKR